MDKVERRRFKRIEVNMLVDTEVWDHFESVAKAACATLVDLSAGGARCAYGGEIAVGERLSMPLKLHDGIMEVQAEVVARLPEQMQVKFLNMTEKQTARVVREVNRELLRRRHLEVSGDRSA